MRFLELGNIKTYCKRKMSSSCGWGSLCDDDDSWGCKPAESSFGDKMNSPDNDDQLMTTKNGDKCYNTSGNPLLDFFFHLTRGYDVRDEELESLWRFDPNKFIQILKHARDVRQGKGEKRIVKNALLWLRKHKYKTYLLNLRDFTERLGCIKDLSHLSMGKRTPELDLIVTLLREDMEAPPDGPISLAAKWAPSEGKQFHRQAKYIAAKLFPKSRTANRKYRKLLTRLRARLNLVETKVCSRKWSEIDYPRIPSRAHKLLRATFYKHDKKRYESYINDCKMGKGKINTSAVLPHELVHACLTNSYDDTIQVMWNNMIKVNLKSSVAIVDVSASMNTPTSCVRPIEVSIALGLMVAEMASGPFKNRVLTFDDMPTWHMIEPDTSLLQKVEKLKWAEWGGSTDLRASFDLILDLATSSHCKQEDIPQTLYIFSDMQFNEACKDTDSTFEYAKKQFESAGYSLPSIVFWNLNGANSGTPIQSSEHNTALVSGFSPILLKLFMKGNLDPVEVMEDAIRPYNGNIDESERYDIHSWDHIPDDMQLEMVLHESPDLDKFTKVGNNVFLQRFRGGMLYSQMLSYFTPRENCYFYIHRKGEDIEEALRCVGNVTPDEIESIRRWSTTENGISDDNLLGIIPTQPNLYLVSYSCE